MQISILVIYFEILVVDLCCKLTSICVAFTSICVTSGHKIHKCNANLQTQKTRQKACFLMVNLRLSRTLSIKCPTSPLIYHEKACLLTCFFLCKFAFHLSILCPGVTQIYANWHQFLTQIDVILRYKLTSICVTLALHLRYM